MSHGIRITGTGFVNPILMTVAAGSMIGLTTAEDLLIQACAGTQAIEADRATRGSIAGMLTGFIRPYWFGGAGYRND